MKFAHIREANISHAAGVFHISQKYFTCPQGQISLKKARLRVLFSYRLPGIRLRRRFARPAPCKRACRSSGGECEPTPLRGSVALLHPSQKRAPMRVPFFGWDGRIRTDEYQSQSLVPYRLATSQYFLDTPYYTTSGGVCQERIFSKSIFLARGAAKTPHRARSLGATPSVLCVSSFTRRRLFCRYNRSRRKGLRQRCRTAERGPPR